MVTKRLVNAEDSSSRVCVGEVSVGGAVGDRSTGALRLEKVLGYFEVAEEETSLVELVFLERRKWEGVAGIIEAARRLHILAAL